MHQPRLRPAARAPAGRAPGRRQRRLGRSWNRGIEVRMTQNRLRRPTSRNRSCGRKPQDPMVPAIHHEPLAGRRIQHDIGRGEEGLGIRQTRAADDGLGCVEIHPGPLHSLNGSEGDHCKCRPRDSQPPCATLTATDFASCLHVPDAFDDHGGFRRRVQDSTPIPISAPSDLGHPAGTRGPTLEGVLRPIPAQGPYGTVSCRRKRSRRSAGVGLDRA